MMRRDRGARGMLPDPDGGARGQAVKPSASVRLSGSVESSGWLVEITL